MDSCNHRADVTWRKSSYSHEGDCVEIALIPDGILVRDSKNPDGSTLFIHAPAWRTVVSIIKYGPSKC